MDRILSVSLKNIFLIILVSTFYSNVKAQSTDSLVIHIYSIDQMRYAVKASDKNSSLSVGESVQGNTKEKLLLLKGIQVTPGRKIHVILTNNSSLPAMAMSHNWVLLKNNVDPNDFAIASSSARSNDYIDKKYVKNVIAHTAMIGGGKTSEVSFTAPEKTGDYTYLCTFPGHYLAGMKGSMVVSNDN